MSYYGNFRNFKFTDIWNEAEDFLKDYKDSGLYADNNKISDDSATTLFYLLYSKYGNSVIASSDPTQFAYQVFAIIYESGPTWEKQIDIQNTLRGMTEANLLDGGFQINNHAFNPSSAPGTGSADELTYINEQNTNRSKRSMLSAYSGLLDLLKTDVTANFLNRFQKLFLQIVEPELPLWYVSKEEDD